MRYIGSDVKLFAYSMPTVGLIHRQTIYKQCAYPCYSMNFVITFPTSLYIVPGLQISKAFCNPSYALDTKNLLDYET